LRLEAKHQPVRSHILRVNYDRRRDVISIDWTVKPDFKFISRVTQGNRKYVRDYRLRV